MNKTLFKLVNKEGCLMDTIKANNFLEARSYFASKFTGNYTIINRYDGLTHNVRFK